MASHGSPIPVYPGERARDSSSSRKGDSTIAGLRETFLAASALTFEVAACFSSTLVELKVWSSKLEKSSLYAGVIVAC